jgi:hypothetical protein
LRDYQAHAAELARAGGTLVVLTSDSEEVLRKVISKQGFEHRFVHATPELWAGWGLENEKRADLPYPTTFIVAPDGTLVFRETHKNHTKRAEVPQVVQRVAAWSAGQPAADPLPQPEEPEAEVPAAPDWDNAVRFAAVHTGAALEIRLQVGLGFHVYGANETISRPLAVSVDQLPGLEVVIPTGEEKTLGEALGTAWVLEGDITLAVPLPPDAPQSLSGQLDYQVCTDSSCTAPTSAPWQAALEDDR